MAQSGGLNYNQRLAAQGRMRTVCRKGQEFANLFQAHLAVIVEIDHMFWIYRSSEEFWPAAMKQLQTEESTLNYQLNKDPEPAVRPQASEPPIPPPPPPSPPPPPKSKLKSVKRPRSPIRLDEEEGQFDWSPKSFQRQDEQLRYPAKRRTQVSIDAYEDRDEASEPSISSVIGSSSMLPSTHINRSVLIERLHRVAKRSARLKARSATRLS